MARPLFPHVLAACAAVPVAAFAPAPPAVAADPVLIESCTTTTLTDAEIAAGEHSEVSCALVDRTQLRARQSRSTVIAIHYDGSSGGGSYLNVFGSCNGGLSFGSSDPWDQRISSTEHRACGTIKHFANSDYTGGPETTEGGAYMVLNLSGFLTNQVSSIAYG